MMKIVVRKDTVFRAAGRPIVVCKAAAAPQQVPDWVTTTHSWMLGSNCGNLAVAEVPLGRAFPAAVEVLPSVAAASEPVVAETVEEPVEEPAEPQPVATAKKRNGGKT
jgi:hypothetical protein